MKEHEDDSLRKRKTWTNLADLKPKELEEVREHLTHKNRFGLFEVLHGILKQGQEVFINEKKG
jgi:hypothetical protein